MWPAFPASRLTFYSPRKKLACVALLCLLMAGAQSVSAQNFSVLYNFTGGNDGGNPLAGVTPDRGGNLYGTTAYGGSSHCTDFGTVGCGTVYKLSQHGGGWALTPLHMFTAVPDGAHPYARVVFGPNGALFGTTGAGGPQDYGTVFELQPPVTPCRNALCPWRETQVHNFEQFETGAYPGGGDLTFDAQANIYGTVQAGNVPVCDDEPCGGAYTLTPDGHGGWSYDATFFEGGISFAPYAGLTRDPSGNLYGVTPGLPGGIYQYAGNSLLDLYYFSGTLTAALGGLISDSNGTLYGTTSTGAYGGLGRGTVFQFVPSTSSFTVLHSFPGSSQFSAGPTSQLLLDAAGNLYGTTHIAGANHQGSVFKLSQSGGVWTFTSLHDFTGGADGGQPFGQLTMDANGNIFGTAEFGGSTVGSCLQSMGCGVVFEITP